VPSKRQRNGRKRTSPLTLRDYQWSRLIEAISEGKVSQSPIRKTVTDVLEEIRRRGDPEALSGMSRFGIETSRDFGVSVPQLWDLAKKAGRSHELALQLWKTGIHEARILAGMIDDPVKVTDDQMDNWAKEFDSWDVVDGSCGNLFDKTPFAVRKAH
jgi:3-methyladenine DNA glycosylase AlkD